MPSVYQSPLTHLSFCVYPPLRNISWCQDGKTESTQTLPLPCRYQFSSWEIQKLVKCVPKEYHNKTARKMGNIFTLESALPAHCIVVYRTLSGSLGRAVKKMALCVNSIQEVPGSVVSESEKRRCQVGRSHGQRWLCQPAWTCFPLTLPFSQRRVGWSKPLTLGFSLGKKILEHEISVLAFWRAAQGLVSVFLT